MIAFASRAYVAEYARTKKSRDDAEHDGPEVEPPVVPGIHIDEKLHELEAQVEEDDGFAKIPSSQKV